MNNKITERILDRIYSFDTYNNPSVTQDVEELYDEILSKSITSSNNDIDIFYTDSNFDTINENAFIDGLITPILRQAGNKELFYGEIEREGVDIIIDFIDKNCSISDDDVFLDLGSGFGKICLHFSYKSKFKKIFGVELNNEYYLNSIKIKNLLNESKVNFMNADLYKLNLSFANFIFHNNLTFTDESVNSIWSRLKPQTHYISGRSIEGEKEVAILELPVSWSFRRTQYKLYIKS